MTEQVDVGVIMGSQSDWPTMKHAAEILEQLQIPHACQIVSAHRTPDRLVDYAKTARARGLKVIIAGAGGAAHLPGMVAAMTTVPVFGVPVQSKALSGQDSLLSIVQMPAGVPGGNAGDWRGRCHQCRIAGSRGFGRFRPGFGSAPCGMARGKPHRRR